MEKKFLNIKSSALQAGRLVCWRLTFEGNFPFSEIENRKAERQFFNFDLRYLSIQSNVAFHSETGNDFGSCQQIFTK